MVQVNAEVHNCKKTCTFNPENIWHLQVTLLTIDYSKPQILNSKLVCFM